MRGYEGRWGYQGPMCWEISHQTSRYLDDCLPISTKIRMTLHLASCGRCRTYVKQVGLVQETLALLPKQNLSPLKQYLLRRQFSARHTQ